MANITKPMMPNNIFHQKQTHNRYVNKQDRRIVWIKNGLKNEIRKMNRNMKN